MNTDRRGMCNRVQLDVSTAYLNAHLRDELYYSAPPGYFLLEMTLGLSLSPNAQDKVYLRFLPGKK
jgi:hypothetical protein